MQQGNETLGVRASQPNHLHNVTYANKDGNLLQPIKLLKTSVLGQKIKMTAWVFLVSQKHIARTFFVLKGNSKQLGACCFLRIEVDPLSVSRLTSEKQVKLKY